MSAAWQKDLLSGTTKWEAIIMAIADIKKFQELLATDAGFQAKFNEAARESSSTMVLCQVNGQSF